MEKKYMYDAFISYRHTEPDKFVAENLHKYMEAFKPPKSILKSGKASRTRIERVFRDKDELPLASNLEDPIISALMQSEYLIVICSPRLKESIWCKKEIETFIEYHGREKVLAVLVEGEPEDSFPEELLYTEEIFYYPDGTQGVEKKPVEPLAADVRGNSKKEILKAMRSELLRLLAPMFSVSYDDLRQRHRERRLKKIVAASVAAAVLCLMIGTASTIAALHIKKQKEQIEEQASEISSQANEIVIQSNEIKEQNGKLLENQAISLAEKSLTQLEEGDRISALKTAGWALTEYDGITMPYTAEAKYALTESLHIYDSGNTAKAQYQMAANGIIDFMCVSPDGKTLVTLDRSQSLCIWDIASGTLIDVLSDIDILFSEQQLTFLDNDRFAYLSSDDSIHIYGLAERQVTDTIAVDDAFTISSDSKGKYLSVSGWHQETIYDMSTLQCLYVFEAETKQADMDCYFSDDDIMIYTETQWESTEEDSGSDITKTLLHFVNLENGEVYATQTINCNGVSNIYFTGQQAFVLARNLFSDNSEIESCIIACSVTDGTSVWEYSQAGKVIKEIVIPYTGDATVIMAYTATEICLLNKATGQELETFSAGSDVAGSAVLKDTGTFVIFSRTGEFGVLYPDKKELLVLQSIIDCKSQNVKKFMVADGCFLILPYNDNRVTVYKMSQNPDMTIFEGDYKTEEVQMVEDSDKVKEAEKLGLEKSALVTNIMYSPDKSVVFISYSDSMLEIYNVEDMTLLENISNLRYDIDKYLGTDQEGNIYISGTGYGYCLDSNYRLTARIEKLLGVDGDNNQLIVGSEDSMYTIPIYTTEELIDMIPEGL